MQKKKRTEIYRKLHEVVDELTGTVQGMCREESGLFKVDLQDLSDGFTTERTAVKPLTTFLAKANVPARFEANFNSRVKANLRCGDQIRVSNNGAYLALGYFAILGQNLRAHDLLLNS